MAQRVIDQECAAYAVGLFYISACTSLDDEAALAVINCEHGGMGVGWRIAEDEFFSDGKTRNGAPCPDAPERRHLLFEAVSAS